MTMEMEHEVPPGQATPAFVRVSVRLTHPDDDYEYENLWCEPTQEDFVLTIRNIPLLAFGYSLNDAVRVAHVPAEDRLLVQSVAARGGHSTYRVILGDDAPIDAVRESWERLAGKGASRELATQRFWAIDIPPDSDIYVAYDILEEGERTGLWMFDEGYCGHPLKS